MHIHDRIALGHLDRMTDPTGIIQHAVYSVPRRESGYTTDDNARALRLCTRLWCRQSGTSDSPGLSRVIAYLSFLEHARCPGRGFHNLMGYDRRWLDAEGCGDCQGQAVRALAEVLASSLPDSFRALARELIDGVLPALADLRSLRAQAYVVLAWGHLWIAGVKDIELLESVAWSAVQRLAECYHRSSRPDWPWFESRMTYANAVLPHALFVAAQRWPAEPFLEVAETSFAFLDRATTEEVSGQWPVAGTTKENSSTNTGHCPPTNVFWPIGNKGWYAHGEDKAMYDQQPIEAVTMADAALAAYNLIGDEKYLDTFRRARDWFHGRNSLGQSLVDAATGACCDGLHPSGVNRNQGAESTLAYLWAELNNVEVQQSSGDNSQAAAIA